AREPSQPFALARRRPASGDRRAPGQAARPPRPRPPSDARAAVPRASTPAHRRRPAGARIDEAERPAAEPLDEYDQRPRGRRRHGGHVVKAQAPASRVSSLDFFGLLRWIDGTPLLGHIEPYRRQIFSAVLDTFDEGRPRYNLALTGRAKKNWKSAD